MRIQEFANHKEIFKLKYLNRDIPHIILETNLSCDIQCKSCYCNNNNYIKPLDEIKKEIDNVIKLRNIEAISIVGGEATLHPDIVEIIKYVKSKKKICQLPSNCRFILNNNDKLLEDLVSAGLDRIFVHIDKGQSDMKDEDVFDAIDKVTEKLEKHKLWYLIAQTIYEDNIDAVSRIIKRYAKNKYFTGVLATIQADFDKIDEGCYDEARMGKVARNVHEELGILPTSYIPTSLNDDDANWLIYSFYMNSFNNNTLSFSNIYYRTFLKLYRVIKGVHAFAMTFSQLIFRIFLPINLLLELLFNIKNIKKFFGVVAGSRFLSGIRFKYIVLQNGPRYNKELGKYQVCYNCPDATIKNGEIMPLCISPLITPDEKGNIANVDLYNDALEHLKGSDFKRIENIKANDSNTQKMVV